VLLNVLVNAAEAAGAGGKVAVSAATQGATVTLAVEDDGPGIPADILPRVFDPFFTTKKNGTGLGLAVAQTIIEAHGGAIEVEPGPGRGTRVLLRLPAAGTEVST
jgi:signal transduction histidine kinase